MKFKTTVKSQSPDLLFLPLLAVLGRTILQAQRQWLRLLRDCSASVHSLVRAVLLTLLTVPELVADAKVTAFCINRFLPISRKSSNLCLLEPGPRPVPVVPVVPAVPAVIVLVSVEPVIPPISIPATLRVLLLLLLGLVLVLLGGKLAQGIVHEVRRLPRGVLNYIVGCHEFNPQPEHSLVKIGKARSDLSILLLHVQVLEGRLRPVPGIQAPDFLAPLGYDAQPQDQPVGELLN